MHEWYDIFDKAFKSRMPKLHRRFAEHSIRYSYYLLQWIMTLFVYSATSSTPSLRYTQRGVLADTCLSPRHIVLSKALPVEVTARVWDMFFLEGPVPCSAVALCVVGGDRCIISRADCNTLCTPNPSPRFGVALSVVFISDSSGVAVHAAASVVRAIARV